MKPGEKIKSKGTNLVVSIELFVESIYLCNLQDNIHEHINANINKQEDSLQHVSTSLQCKIRIRTSKEIVCEHCYISLTSTQID